MAKASDLINLLERLQATEGVGNYGVGVLVAYVLINKPRKTFRHPDTEIKSLAERFRLDLEKVINDVTMHPTILKRKKNEVEHKAIEIREESSRKARYHNLNLRTILYEYLGYVGINDETYREIGEVIVTTARAQKAVGASDFFVYNRLYEEFDRLTKRAKVLK